MAVKEYVRNDVYFTVLPCRKNERIYGFWDLLAIQICFGIGAWFFLIGSQTGMWLSAKQAVPAVIFGNCLGLLLMGAVAIMSARYGVEQLLGSVPIFGPKFTIINIFFFAVTWLCALALAALMFGQSAIKLWAVIINQNAFLASEFPGATIWAVLALAVGFIFAARGPDTLKWFTRIAAVFMMVVLFGLVIYLLFHEGLDKIFSAKPAAPIVIEGDEALSNRWNLASAFEINMGLGLSWAYFYGQFTRLAKTESIGFHGCMWGWGALAAIAGVFAAFAALAIGQYDPTSWLVVMSTNVGFPIIALIGLILMATANISSIATIIYPAAITLVSNYPRMKWGLALAVSTVPALVLCTPGFYGRIAAIYAIIGLINGIYGAIIVTDYFFISKGVYRLRDIFNTKEGYQYFHGVNPAAAIAMAFGLFFYLIVLNPVTWTSLTGWFPYITAGVPTVILTGLLYYILMKVWIIKIYPAPIKFEE
jgi:nucleobase:cation symporter-1, NCS1 family